MWKKLIAMISIVAFISLFTLASAEAGSKQRHMWYGAGIALGAVTALGLLVHGVHAHTPPPQEVYSSTPEPYRYPQQREYVPGHWETIREWVPGTCEKVWVPGHYARWGHWVRGHYVDRQIPGHYVDRRVWVEGYY